MTLDPVMREQVYGYFLTEAQDLLQSIEQDLLSLREGNIRAKIHNMMRAAHTLKGGAASVEQETIKNVAHVLEDVFTALMNPGAVIDAEVESLLFQGYECLRLPLMAEVRGGQVDETEILNRVAAVIAQLQAKLGDCFAGNAALPTSADLGFDVVENMFQVGVSQRLQDIENLLMAPDPQQIGAEMRDRCEVLLGLAESLNLPGFSAIAQITLTALNLHPHRAVEIAELALKDFSAGQVAVLAGDRVQGGAPSAALRQFAVGGNLPDLHKHSEVVQGIGDGDVMLHNASATIAANFDSLADLFAADATAAAAVAPAPTSPDHSSELSLDELFGQYSPVATTPPSPPVSAKSEFTPLSRSAEETVQFPSLESLDFSPEPHAFHPPDSQDLPHVYEVSGTASEEDSFPTSNFFPVEKSSSQWQSYVNAPEGNARGKEAIASSIRVDLAQLERMNYLAGELLIGQNTQFNQDEQQRSILQSLVKRLKKFQQTVYELRDLSAHTTHRTRPGNPPTTPLPHRELTSHSGPLQPAVLNPLIPFCPLPLANFDALELDRYSELDIMLQSALEDAHQVEALAEAVDQLTKQSKRSIKTQQRLLTHLRDDLTNVRMQPLGELLNRFPRVLQQLASSYDKPVELSLGGADVLVDKAVVEKLYDPLLHLLRNAFDHGIESPDVRLAQGKPKVGKIEIQAYHQGNRTVIEIRDDGRGIDLRRMAQKGVELNLITEAQCRHLNPHQILDLLFEPGFSTAAQISDLSGRGVGLDVVRSQLHSLRGSVSVQSTPLKGTTFSLQLPLSLTITKLLVCQTNGVSYALPVNVIEQVVRPIANQIKAPEIAPTESSHQSHLSQSQRAVLDWQHDQQDYEIPVQPLSDLVQYSPLSRRWGSQRWGKQSGRSESAVMEAVVILRTAKGFSGLQVDQVVGEQELVIRSLESEIAPPPYVYGCCTLSNSQLAIVIDPEALLNQRERGSRLAAERLPSENPTINPVPANVPRPAAPSSSLTSANHVLVVDDSFTLRQTVTLSLQKAGYKVSQAGDGLEALVYLRQHPGTIDLIICDIEMPGLNGFEFLSQSRQDPRLHGIPVIMLTSRSTEKYRQMATQLGAAHYLTKPYTDSDLLSILSDLLQLTHG